MPQQYKVPQNIDLEDKIVGPFTMKQFGYLMGGGVLVYAIYQFFQPYENGLIYTIILGLPIAILALALALVKINDRPFENFLSNLSKFAVSPKKRLWQRGYETPIFTIKTPVRQAASDTTAEQKRATLDEISTNLGLAAGNMGPEGAAAGALKQKAQAAQGLAPGVVGAGTPAVTELQTKAANQSQATPTAQAQVAAAGVPTQGLPPQNQIQPMPKQGLIQRIFS